MRQSIRPALVILAGITLLTGVLYPLLITGLAQGVLPGPANGSLIRVDGKPVGSALIGQAFTRPDHFWSRPSATTPTPYQAAASAGSNLGPSNPDLIKNVQGRIDVLRQHDPDLKSVPADLVTTSASGLDPHISPAAAAVQVRRVARARGVDEATVQRLLEQHVEGRQFGILGEPRVNVLRLNMALDAALPPRGGTARVPVEP